MLANQLTPAYRSDQNNETCTTSCSYSVSQEIRFSPGCSCHYACVGLVMSMSENALCDVPSCRSSSVTDLCMGSVSMVSTS